MIRYDTRIVTNDEKKEFLMLGISDSEDECDGMTLFLSYKEAMALSQLIKNAAEKWKKRGC